MRTCAPSRAGRGSFLMVSRLHILIVAPLGPGGKQSG
jgi:hypothetical protein